MTLEILDPGPLTLVQDSGRPGLSALGVGPSGAFDRQALRHLHELLGDSADAAVLESFGDLHLRSDRHQLVAVTGAVGPVQLDGEPAPHGRAFVIRTGQTLTVARPTAGLRTYVGVAGGVLAHEVLGSRSTDTLAGLGPRPLAAGDTLEVGRPLPAPQVEDVPALHPTGQLTVGVVLGPRDDWFSPDAVATLLGTGWTVSGQSDRIGVRLDGPALARARAGELRSEPVVRGSIQVTSAGRPVVLGPDHPVTGGYPVIAVVADTDTDRIAQLRPGDILRFRRRPPG